MPLSQHVIVPFPSPLKDLPRKSGVFDSLPIPKQLEERFRNLKTAASGPEALSLRNKIAKDLEHIHKVYHPDLKELLPVIHAHAGELSDALLERSISACEVAFHGIRSDAPPEAELATILLPIASYALDFIGILSRQKIKKYIDTFDDLHKYFIHFSQCAAACNTHLGESPVLRRASVSGYILAGRMDFYSLSKTQQEDLFLALDSMSSACPAYFIPSEADAKKCDGFWLECKDGDYRGRPLLKKPLPSVSKENRVVVNIDALIHMLVTSEDRHGPPPVQAQNDKAWPVHIRKYVLERLKTPKQKGERAAIRAQVKVLQSWSDIVHLENTRGDTATVLDIDTHGFRAIIEGHDVSAPDVGDMIALAAAGQNIHRAIVTWKKVRRTGAMFGCKFMKESLIPVTLGFLGHSEIAAGRQQWLGLVKQVDEKLFRCWLGDPQLQEGISVLMPMEGKSFSAMLDKVDYRGSNYCQGILTIGEQWQDSGLELDI